MKYIITITYLLFYCGCALTFNYKSISSGAIGCPPSEIKISEERYYMGIDWVAECKGKKYRCSYSGNTQCTEEK